MVDSFSFWVMPEKNSDMFSRLQSRINQLAEENSTLPFEPHVTVLAGINGPEEAVMSAAADLAANMAPRQYNFTNVQSGKMYFQCVYILMDPDGPVVALHNAAKKALIDRGVNVNTPNPVYMPHCSMVYGELDDLTKGSICSGLEGSESDVLKGQGGFTGDSLYVLRTDGSDLSMESWELLKTFKLTGST